jgi:hypothetical protein
MPIDQLSHSWGKFLKYWLTVLAVFFIEEKNTSSIERHG